MLRLELTTASAAQLARVFDHLVKSAVTTMKGREIWTAAPAARIASALRAECIHRWSITTGR